MKKILSILLICTFICNILVSCSSNSTDITNENTSDITTEQTTENKIEETTSDINTKEIKQEETKVDEKTLYKEYIANTKVELLSITSGIPFVSPSFENYNPADYDNKTSKITLGITFPNEEARYALKYIQFRGETATHPTVEGILAHQIQDARYYDFDNLYEIHIYDVNGIVDASKVQIRLQSYYDEIFEDRIFENNGEPVGFDKSIENFPDKIVNLKNRYYAIHLSRVSDFECNDLKSTQNKPGYELSIEYVISLLPLEKGYKITLKPEDIKVIGGTFDDINFSVKILNESASITSDAEYTAIYITAKKHINSVPLDEYGYPDYDGYIPLLREMKNKLTDISIEIDNKDETDTIPLNC